MKKLMAVIGLIGLSLGGYWWYFKPSVSVINISDYADVIKQSEVSSGKSQVTNSESQVSLNAMLQAGIYTEQGILRSQKISPANVAQYELVLNGKALPVKAVSEIELVKAFLIEGNQVVLVGFDQGGNQCTRQYQILTISKAKLQITAPFGSCLALSKVQENPSSIILEMPHNDPYLGPDIVSRYKYQAGIVELLTTNQTINLQHKYAQLTAPQILQQARQDGCYVAGVLLEDNACDGGRKYCLMFKQLKKPLHDDAYKILVDFCANR